MSKPWKKKNKQIKKEMTREEKIELCRIYNESDIEALIYMKKFIKKEQECLLSRLIQLNQETKIGDGDKDYSGEEMDEYYNGKWELLHSFGLDSNMGDAEFEGVPYGIFT